MKLRFLALALLTTVGASGYSYDLSISPVPSGFWTVNGAIYSYSPATFNSTGGSLIYSSAITGSNSNDYEIKTPIASKTGGGTFIRYLRASSNARALSGSCTGNYYSVEFVLPSGTYTNPAAAQLYVRHCSSGTLSTVASSSLAVSDGATIRSVVWGTTLRVYLDEHLILIQTISSTTGQPGIGGYGMGWGTYPCGFTGVSIGPHDVYNPGTVGATGVRSSVFPTSVSLAWQGAADDAGHTDGGIGVYGYNVTRNGTSMGMSLSASFGDNGLSASTTYSYTIAAVDYHGNTGSPTMYSVTTPPSTAVDPRRTGVYTTGSYWGAGGE